MADSVSAKMASAAHSGTHTPQSLHSCGWIARMVTPWWKWSTGQISTQSVYLQRMQFSSTTSVITGLSSGTPGENGADPFGSLPECPVERAVAGEGPRLTMRVDDARQRAELVERRRRGQGPFQRRRALTPRIVGRPLLAPEGVNHAVHEHEQADEEDVSAH